VLEALIFKIEEMIPRKNGKRRKITMLKKSLFFVLALGLIFSACGEFSDESLTERNGLEKGGGGMNFIHPSELQPGDMFAKPDSNFVYILFDNGEGEMPSRIPFLSDNVFYTWQENRENVYTVDMYFNLDDYSQHSLSHPFVSFRPGSTLVKTALSSDIYAVLPGNQVVKVGVQYQDYVYLQNMYGEHWYNELYELSESSFNMLDVLNDNYFVNIDIPEFVATPGSLVSIAGDDDVYYVMENGSYAVVIGELKYFLQDDVRVIDEYIFNNLPIGDYVVTAESLTVDPVNGYVRSLPRNLVLDGDMEEDGMEFWRGYGDVTKLSDSEGQFMQVGSVNNTTWDFVIQENIQITPGTYRLRFDYVLNAKKLVYKLSINNRSVDFEGTSSVIVSSEDNRGQLVTEERYFIVYEDQFDPENDNFMISFHVNGDEDGGSMDLDNVTIEPVNSVPLLQDSDMGLNGTGEWNKIGTSSVFEKVLEENGNKYLYIDTSSYCGIRQTLNLDEPLVAGDKLDFSFNYNLKNGWRIKPYVYCEDRSILADVVLPEVREDSEPGVWDSYEFSVIMPGEYSVGCDDLVFVLFGNSAEFKVDNVNVELHRASEYSGLLVEINPDFNNGGIVFPSEWNNDARVASFKVTNTDNETHTMSRFEIDLDDEIAEFVDEVYLLNKHHYHIADSYGFEEDFDIWYDLEIPAGEYEIINVYIEFSDELDESIEVKTGFVSLDHTGWDSGEYFEEVTSVVPEQSVIVSVNNISIELGPTVVGGTLPPNTQGVVLADITFVSDMSAQYKIDGARVNFNEESRGVLANLENVRVVGANDYLRELNNFYIDAHDYLPIYAAFQEDGRMTFQLVADTNDMAIEGFFAVEVTEFSYYVAEDYSGTRTERNIGLVSDTWFVEGSYIPTMAIDFSSYGKVFAYTDNFYDEDELRVCNTSSEDLTFESFTLIALSNTGEGVIDFTEVTYPDWYDYRNEEFSVINYSQDGTSVDVTFGDDGINVEKGECDTFHLNVKIREDIPNLSGSSLSFQVHSFKGRGSLTEMDLVAYGNINEPGEESLIYESHPIISYVNAVDIRPLVEGPQEVLWITISSSGGWVSVSKLEMHDYVSNLSIASFDLYELDVTTGDMEYISDVQDWTINSMFYEDYEDGFVVESSEQEITLVLIADLRNVTSESHMYINLNNDSIPYEDDNEEFFMGTHEQLQNYYQGNSMIWSDGNGWTNGYLMWMYMYNNYGGMG
jgi:hypothetical protein